ncbi:MAG: lysophospholipid acyltransferase family protein [Ancrocorticia sp.]
MRAPFLMRLIAPLLKVVISATQRVKIRGDVPATGPVIIAANHTNHLDGPVLGVELYRRGRVPCAATRADLFKVPVLGWALKNLGQIPVYRPGVSSTPTGGDGLSSVRALSAALDDGACIVMFPEGTFTNDPEQWPMKGKTGVARLVLSNPDVQVIPTAHWGNEGFLEDGKLRWGRLGRKKMQVTVSFGEPVDFSEFRGREVTRELLTDMTAHVMDAITAQLRELR